MKGRYLILFTLLGASFALGQTNSETALSVMQKISQEIDKKAWLEREKKLHRIRSQVHLFANTNPSESIRAKAPEPTSN